MRPALDESDDRFEAKRFAPSPKAAPSPAKTPEVTKKAATPEAAPAPVQQAPPSAPTKSKTPVRIARRGVGGDELAIDWNDDKPKKKPPSALARRLARGERPSKAKSKSKRAPKEAPPPADTPLAADDHEESTEDVIATLAKERERLARKASVQGARDEAEKAAKKKAKEEKRRSAQGREERQDATPARRPGPTIRSSRVFANTRSSPTRKKVEDAAPDNEQVALRERSAPPRQRADRRRSRRRVKPDRGFVVKPDANWDADAGCGPPAHTNPSRIHHRRPPPARHRRVGVYYPASSTVASESDSEESPARRGPATGRPPTARPRAAPRVRLARAAGRRHGAPMPRLDLRVTSACAPAGAPHRAHTRWSTRFHAQTPSSMLPSARARGLTDRGAPRFCTYAGQSVAAQPPRITPRQSMSYAVCVSTRRRVASASRAAAAASLTSRRRRARSAASAPRARSRCARQPRFWHAAEQKNDETRPVRPCAPSAPRRPRRSRLAPRPAARAAWLPVPPRSSRRRRAPPHHRLRPAWRAPPRRRRPTPRR